MSSVSHLRPYVPVNDKPTTSVAPVPKRTHLVTRSPSPTYSHAASDALPSSRHKPSHSFSESQPHSRSNHNSYNSAASTSNLVPPHLRQQPHTASFWRRHWFVLLLSILTLLSISVVVTVVLVFRAHGSDGGFIPSSIESSTISEALIGTVSQSSVTTPTRASFTTTSVATNSVTGGPRPSAAPTKPP